MIRELDHRSVAFARRPELQALLARAPWIWPPDFDAQTFSWARDFANESIPAPKFGELPVVTFSPGGGADVWALFSETYPRLKRATWGPQAERAWDDAAVAVPRTVPVLWRSVRQVHDSPPVPVWLGGIAPAGQPVLPKSMLDGRSFGLAFFLVFVSRLFNCRVSPTIACSAALDSAGRLEPVLGLEQKIEALLQVTPRVTRFFVAAIQEAKANEIAAGRLEIKPARRPWDIVPAALEFAARDVGGEPPAGAAAAPFERAIVAAAQSRPERRDIIDSFFRLVIGGQRSAVSWAPVERAAAIARREWEKELNEDERYVLELAEGIAARHDDNRGVISMPPAGWLESKPRALQTSVIAQLVQHVADTGTPPLDQVMQRANEYLVEPQDALGPQGQLCGAYGRLYAVTGQPEGALRMQEDLAVAKFASLDLEDMSHPMAEWFRLAGSCQNRAAFFRAEELRKQVEGIGGFGIDGHPYVELSRARACVELDHPIMGAREQLAVLSQRTELPFPIAASATRWLVRLLDESKDPKDGELVETLIGRLLDVSQHEGDDRDQAQVYLHLIELDRALRDGDDARATACVSRLGALERAFPVIVQTAERRKEPVPAYLARYYPY